MVRRLSAGGNRIRTIGPALVKGLSAVADERCRTDKLDGVIKHRSSRETTMVGRGAYSYVTPKTREALAVLRRPGSDGIFFSGEVYAGPDMGTVEAALASGCCGTRRCRSGEAAHSA